MKVTRIWRGRHREELKATKQSRISSRLWIASLFARDDGGDSVVRSIRGPRTHCASRSYEAALHAAIRARGTRISHRQALIPRMSPTLMQATCAQTGYMIILRDENYRPAHPARVRGWTERVQRPRGIERRPGRLVRRS